jgi:hypothetical protein
MELERVKGVSSDAAQVRLGLSVTMLALSGPLVPQATRAHSTGHGIFWQGQELITVGLKDWGRQSSSVTQPRPASVPLKAVETTGQGCAMPQPNLRPS